MSKKIEKIGSLFLKRGVTYYLTYDFFPHSSLGREVKLDRRVNGGIYFDKCRRKATIVKDNEGREYVLHPDAYLFVENPLEKK